MPNIPSFSEDMLPRHFPNTKRQLEQNAAALVPMPTLPGVSLILDDENKIPKVEPKKSFQKWKQQHEAIFTDNSSEYQIRSEKKQVRFQTNNHADGYFNKRRFLPPQRIPPSGSPKLELSYYEPSLSQAESNYRQNQHNQQQQAQYQYPYNNPRLTTQTKDFVKNYFNTGGNSKLTHLPPFVNNAPNGLQNMINLSQFNRTLRSEAIKDNGSSDVAAPVYDDGRYLQQVPKSTQLNGHCCQMKSNSCQPVTNQYPPCTHHDLPNNNCAHEQRLLSVAEQDAIKLSDQRENCVPAQRPPPEHQPPPQQQQLMNPSDDEQKPQIPQMDDDTLFGIMEEQQQHILMQQNQILMQQKQILMQQNQIFILQHQIEKLLLRNGTVENESQNKQRQSIPICEKITASSNALTMRNGSPKSMPNGTKNRSSIGVMTSFLGNLNDAVPNEIRKFNERFTSVANEQFFDDRGGTTSGDQSYKDSMLDKINEVIRNSPAVIDHRKNNGTNFRVSPNKQADVNIEAQTLIYETSSTNNGYMNEQKTTDRSFALYMLGMKYCPQGDVSSNADKRGSSPNQSNDNNCGKAKHLQSNGDVNDHIAVNISPEAYNYLKRHGLLKN